MAEDTPQRIARLERRAARERAARQEAERYLEDKSRQLWDANRRLQQAANELEQRVAQRTAELAAALGAAERANEAKSTFLATMSHELRTPLTAILGYTADLREESDGPELQTIHRNATHLLALINEVLDLSMVESGTFELQPVPTDLAGLLAELGETFAPRAEAAGLTYHQVVAPGVPAWATIDALRLKQVLINLLGNALKFTREGEVGLIAMAVGPERLLVQVHDTGIGISADAQASLFEPFHQVDSAAEGTGLGLAICARLVERMGGELSLTSRVGRGTTFQLALPCPPCEAPNHGTSVAPHARDALAGLHVLLADDAPDSLLMLTRWCERAGARVTAVGDGQQALAAAEGHDIVLMDMQMPVLDGLQATRALRAGGFRAPILALTANTMASDREEAERAGCTGFISKPVARDRLLAAILSHLPTVSSD